MAVTNEPPLRTLTHLPIMRHLVVVAGLLGAVTATHSQSSDNFETLNTIRVLRTDYTRIDTSIDTKISLSKHNMLYGNVARSQTYAAAASDLKGHNMARININLVNNLVDGVNCYFSALDPEGRIFFLASDGSIIRPSSGGSATPVRIGEDLAIPMSSLGQSLNITIPLSFLSGRLYFVEGELSFSVVSIGNGTDGLVQPSLALDDPARDLNWGFVEMSLTEAGEIWSNISYVDFIGIIMSMALLSKDGTKQEVVGLSSDGVSRVCEDLRTQTSVDGRAWDAMCIARPNGTPLRVLSPGNYLEYVGHRGFDDYWQQYVDTVWEKYSSEPLTINTQADAGKVECRVNGELLECAGDNRGYRKPVSTDVWGYNSGPFAIIDGDNSVHYAVVPRLCAAFARSTLLIGGGNYQPGHSDGDFYTDNCTFHYSRIVHDNQVDSKGYAFAYDDVVADDQPDSAGLITSPNPDTLIFFIGGSR